jgi:hypothetical protein
LGLAGGLVDDLDWGEKGLDGFRGELFEGWGLQGEEDVGCVGGGVFAEVGEAKGNRLGEFAKR